MKTATKDPLRPVPAPDEESEPKARRTSSRERAMLFLLAGLAVVGGGAYFLMSSGGGADPEAVAPRPPAATAPAEPQPSPSAEPSPSALPRSAASFGRDPFKPLIASPPPAPAPAPVAASGGEGDPEADAGVAGVRVALLDIFNEGGEMHALIDVDGTEYTVSEGETFAGSFRVDKLGTECGAFAYGDEGFPLCVGQEINR